jgi:hypothetical protein
VVTLMQPPPTRLPNYWQIQIICSKNNRANR